MFILESLCWPSVLSTRRTEELGHKARTIVVYQSSDKAIAFEHRERFKSSPFGHKIRTLHVLSSSEGIVHLASDPVVWNLPISVPDEPAVPKGENDFRLLV